jgi:hypothetical protein
MMPVRSNDGWQCSLGEVQQRGPMESFSYGELRDLEEHCLAEIASGPVLNDPNGLLQRKVVFE